MAGIDVAGLVGGVWDGRGVAAEKLREWRGVKPVAGPSGVAIRTRLHTMPEDEVVLDAVAAHLGELRRADLAAVCRPEPLAADLDADGRRRVRRQRLNSRKTRLTARSSARWANAIMGANNEQYRLARDSQYRHIVGLRAAIVTIEKRLASVSDGLCTGVASETEVTVIASERNRNDIVEANGHHWLLNVAALGR